MIQVTSDFNLCKLEAPLLLFQSQVCHGEQGDPAYGSERGLCKPRLVHVALPQTSFASRLSESNEKECEPTLKV